MRAEIIVPVLIGFVLLWSIGRGVSWPMRLMVAAITLVLVVAVLLLERALA